MFEKLVAEQYERGKALSMAVSLEIDAVIDPADTRNWILRGLKSVKNQAPPWPSPADGGYLVNVQITELSVTFRSATGRTRVQRCH